MGVVASRGVVSVACSPCPGALPSPSAPCWVLTRSGLAMAADSGTSHLECAQDPVRLRGGPLPLRSRCEGRAIGRRLFHRTKVGLKHLLGSVEVRATADPQRLRGSSAIPLGGGWGQPGAQARLGGGGSSCAPGISSDLCLHRDPGNRPQRLLRGTWGQAHAAT